MSDSEVCEEHLVAAMAPGDRRIDRVGCIYSVMADLQGDRVSGTDRIALVRFSDFWYLRARVKQGQE
jgi:hypothetical protein